MRRTPYDAVLLDGFVDSGRLQDDSLGSEHLQSYSRVISRR